MMDRNSLLEKIRALMSKTPENGCTEAEALAAIDKARALMDAYEVTDAELQLSKAEAAIIHSDPPDARDPHKIKRYLGVAVAKFCDCEIWRGDKARLHLCGFPSDVEFASWLLDHLSEFVRAELVSYLVGRLDSKAERRRNIQGFVLGCTGKISRRLTQPSQRSATERVENNRALVVIRSAAITDKMKELNIKLRKSSSRSGSFDRAAHEAGQRAGDRAAFGRPLSGVAGLPRLR
jgi:hypothetical protein